MKILLIVLINITAYSSEWANCVEIPGSNGVNQEAAACKESNGKSGLSQCYKYLNFASTKEPLSCKRWEELVKLSVEKYSQEAKK